jgi:hypothetical protein
MTYEDAKVEIEMKKSVAIFRCEAYRVDVESDEEVELLFE